jgi:outer membrane receptor for ferrienterochelin and colicins
MKKIKWLFYLQLIISSAYAQEKSVSGYIFEKTADEKQALIGANIISSNGLIGTTTDVNGYFTLQVPTKTMQLKVSYVGYTDFKLQLNSEVATYEVIMEANVLEEVSFSYKKLDRSTIDPYNSQVINAAELTKAACCNLSESFETNAAVDVSFSDAVTGAKKLRMLGLDSYYTQILFENQPSIRGLANSFGMLYVPGPFMNSISINKGAGSVVNGYEAITGQINYNYKEPNESERFFINVFASRHGQFELNTNFSHRFNEKLSMVTLVHGTIHEVKHDDNHDSFQDIPLTERIVITNKWLYDSKKSFHSRFGFTYTYDERSAGQLPSLQMNKEKTNLFQTMNINRRYDAYAKTGFILNNPLQSIGIQYRYYNHQHQAWYGNKFYDGLENFANINVIFQTKMTNHNNEMKLGASYQLDYFDESLDQLNLGRQERVPGIFAEYIFQDYKKLSIVAGIRADFHNQYGFWLSPKANLKYNFPKKFTLKLAAGKGYRTANIIAENIGALASSRSINIEESLGYESAWNVGGSLMKEFYLGFQQASIVVDFYRTDFTHRVVSDYEAQGQLSFYNLDGKSYANSFQVEAKVEAAEGLDIQLAYKFDDVHITYKSGLKLAPYIPRHKLLVTLDYETKSEKWRFNVTGQLNGKSRIPSTAGNPEAYQRPDESKVFFNLNTQITAVVKRTEFYLGTENLTSFWQKNPIIAANDPFGSFFDASMIWGPLGGARIYAGFRWTIPYKVKNI